MEYELPVQAVTETIVNAVVHRDYLSTGSVQVMLFRDRLEVWNPGRLPKGMTLEKLTGEHASLPVNPLLANPVYLAGYIEQVGTGTNDVIDRCVELGLRRPEFRQDEDFTVVLWRRERDATGNDGRNGELNGTVNGSVSGPVNGERGNDNVNDSRNDSRNDSVNNTYQAIKANPGIRRKRIAELTGKSVPTIDRHLALLSKSNLIEHRGSDKTGGYYVKK